MVHVELTFTNTTMNKDFHPIKFVKSVCHRDFEKKKKFHTLFFYMKFKKSNVNIQGFDEIDRLPSGTTVVTSIGIDYNDKTQPAAFEISFDGNVLSTPLTIACHVGELIEQRFLNEKEFHQHQGINLNEQKEMKENFHLQPVFVE